MNGHKIAALGAALSIALSSAHAQPSREPVSGAWLVATFKSACFEPFGDREKVRAAAESSALGFTAIAPGPGPALPGSQGWESPRARLGYSTGEGMPRDLPAPQCSLTALAAPGYDHAATATALTAALGLPPGKSRGRNGRFTTEWNYPGIGRDKRRLFLSAEPGPAGTQLRVSLLNLRK